jgi:hypothetical protein
MVLSALPQQSTNSHLNIKTGQIHARAVRKGVVRLGAHAVALRAEAGPLALQQSGAERARLDLTRSVGAVAVREQCIQSNQPQVRLTQQ